MATKFGQYEAPTHVVAHLSDTHFLGDARQLYGTVDTDGPLVDALGRLETAGTSVDALVITGDLTDLGEPDAYRRLRSLVEPVAERLDADIVWVMGNHDERVAYAKELSGAGASGVGAGAPDAEVTDAAEADAAEADAAEVAEVKAQAEAPQDAVHHIRGLRIISFDTTVPGYHHGDVREAQLNWLSTQLAVPAPHGTLLALHHPPIPSSVEMMAILELQHQDLLAEVIHGSDVRAILGGHLHYATAGQFAGVPVFVAAGSCYTIDAAADPDTLVGRRGGQTLSLVHIRPDAVTTSVVPLDEAVQVAGFSSVVAQAFAAMEPMERLEAFSSKSSTFTLADAERIVAGLSASTDSSTDSPADSPTDSPADSPPSRPAASITSPQRPGSS